MSTFLTILLVCAIASTALADYGDVSVAEHNKYRARHRVPSVSRDREIDRVAQNYARYVADSGNFQHSGNQRYGENLYMAWGGSRDLNVHVRNAISSWYNEIKDYDFNRPGFSYKSGHFTAVVWKNSKRIGTGAHLARDPKYGHRVAVVVNYSPPGNVIGQFPENVPRPS